MQLRKNKMGRATLYSTFTAHDQATVQLYENVGLFAVPFAPEELHDLVPECAPPVAVDQEVEGLQVT